MGALAIASMGLMAYSAAGQYSGTKAAGEMQRMEYEAQAELEELAATQQEGDRKARLAEAMASQVAGSGASGIAAFQGSPLTILQADLEAEQRATQRGRFQSGLAAEGFRMKGKTAEKMAAQQAKMGLLSNISSMAWTAGKGLSPRGGKRYKGSSGGKGYGAGIGTTYNPYSQQGMVS